MEVHGGAAAAAAGGKSALAGLAANLGSESASGGTFAAASGACMLRKVDAQHRGEDAGESDEEKKIFGLVAEHGGRLF